MLCWGGVGRHRRPRWSTAGSKPPRCAQLNHKLAGVWGPAARTRPASAKQCTTIVHCNNANVRIILRFSHWPSAHGGLGVVRYIPPSIPSTHDRRARGPHTRDSTRRSAALVWSHSRTACAAADDSSPSTTPYYPMSLFNLAVVRVLGKINYSSYCSCEGVGHDVFRTLRTLLGRSLNSSCEWENEIDLVDS